MWLFIEIRDQSDLFIDLRRCFRRCLEVSGVQGSNMRSFSFHTLLYLYVALSSLQMLAPCVFTCSGDQDLISDAYETSDYFRPHSESRQQRSSRVAHI